MSGPSNFDRLEELAAEEVVFGLQLEHREELDRLMAELESPDSQASADDLRLAADFEQAAAAYYLAAGSLETGSLPQAVRDKVLTSAATWSTSTATPAVTTASDSLASPSSTKPAIPTGAWLAALAATLLLGLFVGRPSVPGATSVAEQRIALLESDPQVTQLAWTATEDPSAEGASGDVVWSDRDQRGYMTFRGLAVNDPTKEQYQLWIFDAERDDRYPVDGGVFDIAPGATEVVTTIDAKIDVNQAVMFAITIEKPGGVVVSDRSRLPLLAKVE